jgi:hypothetical protein
MEPTSLEDYWDNQPAWKAVGDFLLCQPPSPPNQAYADVYRSVYDQELTKLAFLPVIEHVEISRQ